MQDRHPPRPAPLPPIDHAPLASVQPHDDPTRTAPLGADARHGEQAPAKGEDLVRVPAPERDVHGRAAHRPRRGGVVARDLAARVGRRREREERECVPPCDAEGYV